MGERDEEFSDGVLVLDGVPQREFGVDLVLVAAPDPFAAYIAGLDEIADDALRGPFSDPVLGRYVAAADL